MDHHAYVYIGNDLTVVPKAVAVPTNDIEHLIADRLAIGDARHLKEVAYRRPQAAPERHIVVVARDMPAETQNALLKLLEEPPATSVFHLVVPRRDILLPTILSRVQVTDVVTETTTSSDTFTSFLSATYKDRLEQIETAHKKKDTAWFAALFTEVETYVASQLSSDADQATRLLTRCIESRRSGASQKMLAEDVALTLPDRG